MDTSARCIPLRLLAAYDPVLNPALCYFVRVCGFTFEFWSTDHIVVALDYFRQKVHPSSRVGGNWGEHDVTQRWYERLPLDLQRSGKRERVVAALEQALRSSHSPPLNTIPPRQAADRLARKGLDFDELPSGLSLRVEDSRVAEGTTMHGGAKMGRGGASI